MSNVSIAKPQVEIDEDLKELLTQQTEECTIVHCRYYTDQPTGIRIWPSTFLIQDNGRRCKLIKNFNISLVPDWTYHFIPNEFIRFTLVFEALGKECMFFQLLEEIPQPFGFYSNKVQKNNSGVYTVEVFCA
ncbi:MAG: hypothetical protein JWP81_2608 [Ferruginibacter sp.]|nr:hypothetical protein [Ferruginibacter sp.]